MSIAVQAIAALRWAAAAKLLVQFASWSATLVIIRILTPQDYGLMAKVAVVSGLAGAIAELGLGAAITRSINLERDDLRRIQGASLLFSLLMTAAVAAASPLLAILLNEPRLAWPVAVASLQIVISAVSIVPAALWERELLFGRLSVIETVSGIATIACTLALAVTGAGVWSLVVGTLFGVLVRSACLLIYGSRLVPLFSLRGIGEHLKFGLTVVANRVSYFGVMQSDVLIASAFLSTTEIGHYSVALQLATLPMAKAMGTINQIMLPAIARQQADQPAVRQALLKSIGLVSLIAFPTLWGMSAVAPEFVRLVFGPGWLYLSDPLMILPLIVPLRMVSSVIFTTSLALGNRRLDLRNTAINFVVLPSGFFIGAHWGLQGLCLAWLVSLPVVYVLVVPSMFRFIGIRPREFAAEIVPPAVSAAVMYAAVTTLRPLVAEQPLALSFPALVMAGAITYALVALLIARRQIVTARGFASVFFKPRRVTD